MSRSGRDLKLNRLMGYLSTLLRPDQFNGHVDSISQGRIEGWIRRVDVDDPLVVDLYVDGLCVEAGHLAHRQRTDVSEAGFGMGRCGFLFALPSDLDAARRHEVEIRLSETGQVLLRCVLDAEDASAPQAGAGPSGEPEPIGAAAPDDPVPDAALQEVAALGAEALLPLAPEFRAKIEKLVGETLSGWAVDASRLDQVFDVNILIDGVAFDTVRTDRQRDDLLASGGSGGQGGFQANVPLAYLDGGKHEVSIRLPDRSLYSRTVETVPRPARLFQIGKGRSAADVAIIVPIHNAADDLAVCIERLRLYTPAQADIILIDDASTDCRIGDLLADATATGTMRVLRNAQNLGFTATVNRGLQEAGRRDVVLLNSDARVTPGWLQGLLAAARSGPLIATVTPMSDRAGAFSAPEMGNENPLPPGVDEVDYARAFRRRSLGLYPEVPTGNGFCMFVSRACLDEVGLLDVKAFPRGYGEENDFCMRAGRAGWRHVIDDRTYIFHDRSKSFGNAKADLLASGRVEIGRRYPEYATAISAFRTSPKIKLARWCARQALRDCGEAGAVLPRVLYVISTQTGGTPQTNLDLMTALNEAVDCWVLRCDSRTIELSHLRDGLQPVRRHRLEEPIDPIRHASAEYDAVVAQWLGDLDADLVHIRHLGWHGLSLPRLAKEAGLGVVFSFHDFYTLCPTIKLIDHEDVFRGGDCASCEGLCRVQLWPRDSLPALTQGWVGFWRSRFERVLTECDAFVTTSEPARARLLEHLPLLPPDRFEVISHGRDFDGFSRLRRWPEHGKPLRILVPGNIDTAKGLGVMRALVEQDVDGLLELHVLGKVNTREHLPHPRVITHGLYARSEFAERAAMIGAHLGAVFSIWDETYCHTLTELWSIGLPVVVLDYPTLAARMRASGAGWVMSQHDIPALHAGLLRVAFDPAEQRRTEAALLDWQTGEGLASGTRVMAASYLDTYRRAIRHHRATTTPTAPDAAARTAAMPAPWTARDVTPRIALMETADRPLSAPEAASQGRIWERTRNGLDRGVTFMRLSPAQFLASLEARRLDGAVLQAGTIPRTLHRRLLDAFEATGTPYLLDLDGDPAAPAPTETDPAQAELLQRASVATAPLEGSAAASPGTRLAVLPNRLSRTLWGGPLPGRREDGVVRALYIDTAGHGRDFALIRPALRRLLETESAFRVTVVGLRSEEVPKRANRIEVPEWVRSYPQYVAWLRAQAEHFDFGLAPSTRPWTSSTPDVAALWPLALGLPALVSAPADRDSAHRVADGLVPVPNTILDWRVALLRQIARHRDDPHREDQAIGAGLRTRALVDEALEPSLPSFDALLAEMAREGRRSS